MKRIFSLLVVLVLAPMSFGQGIKDAIKKVEAVFDPAEAKPGQTVRLKVTVALADGYFTYPVVQPDEGSKFSVNKFTFPSEGPFIFVGDVLDPAEPKTKKEGEMELLYYPGGGSWIRKAVVSPLAKAGATSTKLKFRLLVCDKDNCFPPKNYDLEATLKVLEGPAVAVEKAYQTEVNEAIKKK
jgi:hypothetical protein